MKIDNQKDLKFDTVDVGKGKEENFLFISKSPTKIYRRELSIFIFLNILVNPFAADISKIENTDPNESIISIKNNKSLIKQKINYSVDHYDSYQTSYEIRRDKTTHMTSHLDEEGSTFIKRKTEDSQDLLQPTRFMTHEDDPLYDDSIENKSMFGSVKNRSRAYVTTAPLFKKKQAIVDRKERINEIRDFKAMNKSMLTLFR